MLIQQVLIHSLRSRRLAWAGVLSPVVWSCLCAVVVASDRPGDSDTQKPIPSKRVSSATTASDRTGDADGSSQDRYEELELFDAMKRDMVGVLVEPRDFSVLRMSMRNKTDRPLLIRAPEVFSAIPAQRVISAEAAAASGMGDLGYGYAAQSAQGLGGSFYLSDSSAAFPDRYSSTADSLADSSRADRSLPKWLLQPGKIVTAPVPCFCLEFGKPDPNPSIPYLLRPLTDLTTDEVVRDLLIQFSRRQYSQRVTQLAIWHVGNQVPWPKLAQGRLPRSMAGRNQTFSAVELQAARSLVEALPAYQQRFQFR